MDTFASRSIPNEAEMLPLNPPPDLAGIIAAWPTIPDQIRQAVKAIVAPYMTKEGGK